MSTRTVHNLVKPDVYDVISATWVFACNDENPILTYEGIRHRLGLAKSFDVVGLVNSRGDLFRRGVHDRRLKEWKNEMLQGKRLPSWIRDIKDDVQRTAIISQLSASDVFRSQFRAKEPSAQSSIEVIDWGLQHIDRLRKAHYEAQEKTAKSWQMWLLFAIGLINALFTGYLAYLKAFEPVSEQKQPAAQTATLPDVIPPAVAK